MAAALHYLFSKACASSMFLTWVYILMLVADIGLMLTQLYFIIMYSDLESDYLSPIDLCNKMEKAEPAETVVQAAVSTLLLLSGDWISLLLTLPITAYNAYQYYKTKFEYDATTIFRTLGSYKVASFVKLGYYFLMFCYFLYSMIWSLIVSSEV